MFFFFFFWGGGVWEKKRCPGGKTQIPVVVASKKVSCRFMFCCLIVADLDVLFSCLWPVVVFCMLFKRRSFKATVLHVSGGGYLNFFSSKNQLHSPHFYLL